MKIKVISLFICLLLIVVCFTGCKDIIDTNSDVSSNIGTTSSVPIVIVDDEDESKLTQSEIDEILNDWENNNPSINIEVDTDGKDDNSSTNSSSDNGSDSTTSEEQGNNSSNDSSDSSTSQESSDDSSTDNSSDNSSNTDSSDTGSEDDGDGYFNVAV